MKHHGWLLTLALLTLLLSGCQNLPAGFDEFAPEPEEEATANVGWIGGACEATDDCLYPQARCLTEDDGYPKGQCTQPCDRICPDQDGTNSVTFCIDGNDGEGICASRCDLDLYPDSGCRPEYICQILPRSNDPSVQTGVCVPEQLQRLGDSPQAATRCQATLEDANMTWADWDYQTQTANGTDLQCTISDPVRIQSPINGVRYRTRNGSDNLAGSCDLAIALDRLGDILADYGIVEVIHLGTFNCRTISGTNRLSQHGHGQAIDIWGFVDQNGQDYVLERDWEIDNPNPTNPQGKVLYAIAQSIFEAQIFNIILTPDYNAAHRNHFHVDLTEGSRFIGSSAPEEHWIGSERELCPGW